MLNKHVSDHLKAVRTFSQLWKLLYRRRQASWHIDYSQLVTSRGLQKGLHLLLQWPAGHACCSTAFDRPQYMLSRIFIEICRLLVINGFQSLCSRTLISFHTHPSSLSEPTHPSVCLLLCIHRSRPFSAGQCLVGPTDASTPQIEMARQALAVRVD